MVKLRCYLRTILLIAIGLSWFSGAMADLNEGLVAYFIRLMGMHKMNQEMDIMG